MFHPDLKIENSKWFLFSVIIFYLLVAYHSSGFHNPDEHFQIIEFANYKLGLAKLTDLAWEFNAQIRPGLQPALCFLLFKFLHLFGITDAYHLACILRAITALLAVMVIKYFISSSTYRLDKKYHLAFALLSYFLWFLPYINVRFSSETWSGLFFLLSLAIIQRDESQGRKNNILMGMVLGIAVLFRYQSALLVLGVVLWLIFIRRINFSKLVTIALSGLTVLLIGFLIGRWLYGQFAFTLYNYFHVNIIQDVASKYGVSPWYEIILYIINGPGPIGIFIFISFILLLILQPKHIIIWACLPFLMVHAIIPHKELRFLFPIANIAPVLLIIAYQKLSSLPNAKRSKYIAAILFVVLVVVNIAGIVVVSTKSAGNTKISVAQYIHQHYAGERINIIHLEKLNPYSDWQIPVNTFYRNKNVKLKEVLTIWQSDIERKKQEGYRNLLIISNSEVTGPKTFERLNQLKAQKVFQSIPDFDQTIIRFYKESLNDDNLMIYELID